MEYTLLDAAKEYHDQLVRQLVTAQSQHIHTIYVCTEDCVLRARIDDLKNTVGMVKNTIRNSESSSVK